MQVAETTFAALDLSQRG